MPIAVGFAIATIAWFAMLALVAVATRTPDVEPAAAGLELGGEQTPAVAGLVTNHWRVPRAAATATAIDLAARQVLTIGEPSPGHYTLGIGTAAAVGLQPYEELVVALVRRVGDGAPVPFEALTMRDAVPWFDRFAKAVVKDARASGLSRPRWSRAITVLMTVLAVGPAVLFSALASDQLRDSSTSSNDDAGQLAFAYFMIGFTVLLGIFHSLRAERETAEGLAVARRWLGLRDNLREGGAFADLPPTAIAVWDRYLGYGVALGVAVTTARLLPLGPEPDDEAWSRETGEWRLVHISYRKVVPPGWGKPPWKVFVLGALSTAIGVAGLIVLLPIVEDARADTSLSDAVEPAVFGFAFAFVIVVFGAGAVIGTLRLLLGLSDIRRSREVSGTLVRLRSPSFAVDDGTDDHIHAYVSLLPQGHLVQGSRVQVTVSPRLGYVRAIESQPSVAR
jgi:hypothetical protein